MGIKRERPPATWTAGSIGLRLPDGTIKPIPLSPLRADTTGERKLTMKTEDLTPEQMQMALTSFREWAKLVVKALGDEPTFEYDYDAVPGKIEALREQLAEVKS
jgi:hypothetical protein